ncbi:MAG: SxtJ family membrane protein [Acidobacteriota bacterium]
MTRAAKLAPHRTEEPPQPLFAEEIDEAPIVDAWSIQHLAPEPESGEPRPASNRTFGLVMTAFFALLGVLPAIHRQPIRLWALTVASTFLFVTLLRADLLAPLNGLWTALGAVMHRIMTPLVLGVIFYALITPVAFVMRVFGRDALGLKLDSQAKTYWKTREPGPAPESMRQQF